MAKLGDNLIKDTKSLLAGASRGLTTDLVGAPVDIVADAMRGMGIPIPTTPVGGSKFLRKLTGQPETDTPVEAVGNVASSLVNPVAATLKGAAIAGVFLRPHNISVDAANKIIREGGTPTDVFKKTGIFPSADGKSTRVELSDINASASKGLEAFMKGKEISLYGNAPDIMKHDELYNDPDVGHIMKDLKVIIQKGDPQGGVSGAYHPGQHLISVEVGRFSSKKNIESVILHEMQHVVQESQGMHRGTNPDAMLNKLNTGKLNGSQKAAADTLKKAGHTPEGISELLYWSMAGEVEARAVANRYGMTLQELKSTMPVYDTPTKRILTNGNQ